MSAPHYLGVWDTLWYYHALPQTLIVWQRHFTLTSRRLFLRLLLQFLKGMKLPEVVHFRFENPPETLHRAVVDASAGPGHTLRCMDTVQLCFELPVGVLVASVTVKQRMGAGVGAHRSVKGVKNKLIVVGLAQCMLREIRLLYAALHLPVPAGG